jgi:hypothetical protein
MLVPTVGSPYIYEYTITDTDHGLVTGSIYDFKVVATNDVGSSLFSPKLENIMAAQLPTPPIDPVQVYSTSTTITYDWSDPEDNGGTPILDFEIYWNEGVDDAAFVLLQHSTLGMNIYY